MGRFKTKHKKETGRRYVRGAKLITAEEFKEQAQQRNENLDLPLGSIKMPRSLENRHTIFIGKSGSGKSQAIRAKVKGLAERNEKGIIYDYKGEYISEFYREGIDQIFNPLDARSLGWNIFNELETYPDVDATAASLIPPSIANTDPFWNDAARGVFSGCIHYLGIFAQNRKNIDRTFQGPFIKDKIF